MKKFLFVLAICLFSAFAKIPESADQDLPEQGSGTSQTNEDTGESAGYSGDTSEYVPEEL